jgi:thiosulfate dehydrogenase [quinone] large subunit
MLERLFHRYQLHDPPFYQFLFGNVFMAPFFTVARVYVGWQFLQAGYHKVTGDGWLNQDGSALKGFWERAVAIPQTGSPPIKFDWYRDFLQFMLDHHWYTWFAWIIAFGETIAGIALIIGALTAFAALGGAFMNFNFMLAGSASTNPVLFLLALLLIAGWKVSGYIGLDRWLLPLLGTPWQAGSLFHVRATLPEEAPGQPGRALPST